MILKWIINNAVWEYGLDSSASGQDPVVGFCEHGFYKERAISRFPEWPLASQGFWYMDLVRMKLWDEINELELQNKLMHFELLKTESAVTIMLGRRKKRIFCFGQMQKVTKLMKHRPRKSEGWPLKKHWEKDGASERSGLVSGYRRFGGTYSLHVQGNNKSSVDKVSS
jgi:hypothetical protein